MKSGVDSSGLTSPGGRSGNDPATLSQNASQAIGQDEVLEPILVHADSILEDMIPEYLEDCKAGVPLIQTALEQNDYPALRNISAAVSNLGWSFLENISFSTRTRSGRGPRRLTPNPNDRGCWLVSCAAILGRVQAPTVIASSKTTPLAASFAIVGDVGSGYPYA